MISTMNS